MPHVRTHTAVHRWLTGVTCAYGGDAWRLAPFGSFGRPLARRSPREDDSPSASHIQMLGIVAVLGDI